MGRLLLVVATLAAVLAASAGAVTPPKGTPNLAAMALQATDFTGAKVTKQGYMAADDTFIAKYERILGGAQMRVGSKRLLAAVSDVDLMRSADAAHRFMALVPLAFTLIDPKDLASGLAAHVTYVKAGKPTALHAGHEGFAETIRVGTKGGELRMALAFIRVDRVVDVLVVLGAPRSRLGIADTTAIARHLAAHNLSGLVPVNGAPPTIGGTPAVGQTLTASPGGWSNAPSAFAYSWQRCDATGATCVDTGATGTTYLVGGADTGSTLRVTATATNRLGSGHATSAPTAPVAGPPLGTAPPAVTGTATVGQALTASTGTWAGDPTAFAYQWQRCDATGANCAAIDGATSSSYTVAAADVGSTLRVAVTATNALGSATAVSAQTAVIA